MPDICIHDDYFACPASLPFALCILLMLFLSLVFFMVPFTTSYHKNIMDQSLPNYGINRPMCIADQSDILSSNRWRDIVIFNQFWEKICDIFINHTGFQKPIGASQLVNNDMKRLHSVSLVTLMCVYFSVRWQVHRLIHQWKHQLQPVSQCYCRSADRLVGDYACLLTITVVLLLSQVHAVHFWQQLTCMMCTLGCQVRNMRFYVQIWSIGSSSYGGHMLVYCQVYAVVWV